MNPEDQKPDDARARLDAILRWIENNPGKPLWLKITVRPGKILGTRNR